MAAKNTAIANALSNAGISGNIDITALDVSKLDMGELLALMEKVNGESQKRNEEIKKEFQDYINSEIVKLTDRVIKKYGKEMYFVIQVSFVKEEIKETTNSAEKVANKFINPDNSKELWTGRGMPPKWVSKYIETHKITLEEFKTAKEKPWVIKEETQKPETQSQE